MPIATYNKSSTLNGILDSGSLYDELSSLSVGVISVNDSTGDMFEIVFQNNLDADQTQLVNDTIAAHTGEPLPQVPTIVSLNSYDGAERPLVAIDKGTGDFDTIVTPNLARVDNTVDTIEPIEIKPSENENLFIVKAEAQFNHDLQLEGETVFHLDYYVWFEHPDFGFIEVVGAQRSFPNIKSLFELGNEHYHSPPIGTEVPFGLTTISFSYPSRLELYGQPKQYGLSKLVCRLENDKPAKGTYVSIGFVVTKEST